jgi:hypothetical protein
MAIISQVLEENYEVTTQSISDNSTEIYNKESDIFIVLE